MAGGAKVIGDGLSFLGEDGAEKGQERGLVDAKLGEAGGEAPAEDGGVDIGRWGKGGGRKREEVDGGTVELDGDGEDAVFAGAGLGGDAVGDFALHHEGDAIDGGVALSKFEEDGRGDVVGQVAEDEEGLAGSGGSGGEVEGEDVLVDYGDVLCGELGAEVGGEGGVEFDGDEAVGAGGESVGDGSGTRTDFDGGAGGEIAEGVGDALDGGGVVEEVLSEFGFGGHGVGSGV